MSISPLRRTLAVLRKDLLLEWRRRARWLSVVLFGVVVLLLFSFAIGPDSDAMTKASGGLLILALLLSSTLALSESFRTELADQAIEGLLMLPIGAVSLYYGKALANTLLLFVLAPVLVPIAFVLYNVQIEPGHIPTLFGVLFLAAAGFSAPGTLYAGMTARIRSQDVLLPLLLFPLLAPMLLASVKALTKVITGDPMSELSSWVSVLVAFDVIYWTLCGALFPFVGEAGN